jgi:hypothetical protein
VAYSIFRQTRISYQAGDVSNYCPFIIIPLLFIHHYPITIPLLFDYHSTCIPLNLQEIAATSLLNFHPSESEGGAGATDGPDSGGGLC